MQKNKRFGFVLRMLIIMFVGALIGGLSGLYFGNHGLLISLPICMLWGIKSDEIIDFITQPQND